MHKDDEEPTALRLVKKHSLRVESAEKDRDGAIRSAVFGRSLDEITAATGLSSATVRRILSGRPAWPAPTAHEVDVRNRYLNNEGYFFAIVCSCGDEVRAGPKSSPEEAETAGVTAWDKHVHGGLGS